MRFLFRAMAPKEDNPFEGIPENIQIDGGPVGKSSVFKRVMECLGITVSPHMPAGSDGRRTTARAKGKVERPFRTVKEAHETLYHFHEPASEQEANRWLARYIATYNSGDFAAGSLRVYPGGSENRHILATVSRLSPKTRAASRRL